MAIPKPSPRGKSSRFSIDGAGFQGKTAEDNARLKSETIALRKRIAHLAGALDRANAPRRKILLAPAIRTRGRERTRVIIPDSHGSAIDARAANTFLADLKTLAPTEIVMLGDHVDCGGFLAQHHTLGYVAQTDYCYEDDIAAANTFLDAIQRAAPRAAIHYIEGNHERRVETWCVTQTLRHSRDCEMLRRAFAPEFLLHLKARGIKYYRQGEHYHGLIVPGAIRLEKCFFWHGVSAAKQAASVNIQQFAGNIVYGHTHRTQADSRRPVSKGDIGAWCPGCLCQQQPLWQHTRPTDWTLGYGVQMVETGGNFLHINVPIVDARSLLMPLLKKR